MARLLLTKSAQRALDDASLTLTDVAMVIGEFRAIDTDYLGSGMVRAGCPIGERMVWVTYIAQGDTLIVVTVEVEG